MYKWSALLGRFEETDDQIEFMGEPFTMQSGEPGPSIGNYISDQRFSTGMISAKIKFNSISEGSACELILNYQPSIPAFLSAGIGGPGMFSVRTWASGFGWTVNAMAGDRANLKPNREYEINASVMGSRVTLTVDGVDVIVTTLPYVANQGQTGIFCSDIAPIYISNYYVSPQRPLAFVVMQFTKPYDELYAEVIRPVCEEFSIQAVRADETYGPGLIVADITRQIIEANLVVAEITPANPNVYYEVGYAHALNKPTILVAEKGTSLPFDVNSFRTLFYENSIDGKRRIENGLRKHLQAILPGWGNYSTKA